MSALPPKADILQHGGNVRFVPKADVGLKLRACLALQWQIDDREALLVLLEGDVGDAEHFA